jgi:hypothetical protein
MDANYSADILYATTLYSDSSRELLQAAVKAFLSTAENEEEKLLFSLYYEQQGTDEINMNLDLAFNDNLLANVENEWKSIMLDSDAQAQFMTFEEWTGVNEEEDDEA